ncbi:MAG: acetyltransferase, partial [Bacteroidota bacterium]
MLKQLINGLALLGFLLGISLFLWAPFGALYLLSSLVAGLLYRVLRYRRKVVIGNLQASFPELDTHAVEKIARDFYRHFS